METETLDKIYLEYSQFTSAKTNRELELEACIRSSLAIKDLWYPGYENNGYDNEYLALDLMYKKMKRLLSVAK